MGTENRSAIVALVERVTRYLILVPVLTGRPTASGVRDEIEPKEQVERKAHRKSGQYSRESPQTANTSLPDPALRRHLKTHSVLVRAALPRAAGVGEENTLREEMRDQVVPRHLSTLIPDQCPGCQHRQVRDGDNDHGRRGHAMPGIGQVHEPGQPGRPIDQRAGGRQAMTTDDQIALEIVSLNRSSTTTGRSSSIRE